MAVSNWLAGSILSSLYQKILWEVTIIRQWFTGISNV